MEEIYSHVSGREAVEKRQRVGGAVKLEEEDGRTSTASGARSRWCSVARQERWWQAEEPKRNPGGWRARQGEPRRGGAGGENEELQTQNDCTNLGAIHMETRVLHLQIPFCYEQDDSFLDMASHCRFPFLSATETAIRAVLYISGF